MPFKQHATHVCPSRRSPHRICTCRTPPMRNPLLPARPGQNAIEFPVRALRCPGIRPASSASETRTEHRPRSASQRTVRYRIRRPRVIRHAARKVRCGARRLASLARTASRKGLPSLAPQLSAHRGHRQHRDHQALLDDVSPTPIAERRSRETATVRTDSGTPAARRRPLPRNMLKGNSPTAAFVALERAFVLRDVFAGGSDEQSMVYGGFRNRNVPQMRRKGGDSIMIDDEKLAACFSDSRYGVWTMTTDQASGGISCPDQIVFFAPDAMKRKTVTKPAARRYAPIAVRRSSLNFRIPIQRGEPRTYR